MLNEYYDSNGNRISLEEHLEQTFPAMLDLIATWMAEWLPDEPLANPHDIFSQLMDEASQKDYFGTLLNASDELA